MHKLATLCNTDGQYILLAAFGLPFLIAGSLKIIYALSLWFTFQGLKPAEKLEPKLVQ